MKVQLSFFQPELKGRVIVDPALKYHKTKEET
jgi:hypothetical protein